MPWTFVEFEDNDILVVIRNAQHHLTGLTDAQSQSAKVATSNQQSGAARSLVVWKTDGDAPPPYPMGMTWTVWVWRSENDYFSMYKGLVAALNQGTTPNGTAFTAASAWYSLLSMSNMRGGDGTVSLYFRV